jgi:hypothetical protein
MIIFTSRVSQDIFGRQSAVFLHRVIRNNHSPINFMVRWLRPVFKEIADKLYALILLPAVYQPAR